jgi:biotin carboxyl carrier protein
LAPRQINAAKGVASEVFPLERAVTPFSEYKLRLGIAIMIEDAIQPKTVEAVRAYVKGGGKLKVGGEVLVGLKRWETLVTRPEAVDQLLANMADELAAALEQGTRLVGPGELPAGASTAQRFTALGFQQKGLDFVKLQSEGKDLTPLLTAPEVLHRQPLTLAQGSQLSLLQGPGKHRTVVDFLGFGKAPNGYITVGFRHAGTTITTQVPDPNAVAAAGAEAGLRKADASNPLEMGTVVPGELISNAVAVGDVLEEGQPLCVLESMKMEVKLSVPPELHGAEVVSVPCKGRTATHQGDILAPGDLLVECKPAASA